jgi:hypothetical protein
MIEMRVSCQGGIEAFTLVVGMTTEAALDRIDQSMSSFFLVDITLHIFMAVQTQHVLGFLERLVAKAAIALKRGMRRESL